MNPLFRPHPLPLCTKQAVLIIAHRMRTIAGADLIAGLRERRQGAPDERMRADGSWPAQDKTAAARRRLGAKMKHTAKSGTFPKEGPAFSRRYAFAKAENAL